MADPTITEARGVSKITTSVAVAAGELLGWNGSAWAKADADARVPAEGVAMYAAPAAGTVDIAESGVLVDTDAPFTAGGDLYLSATAGAMTHTIPALSATLTLLQRLGRAISASEVRFNLNRRGPQVLRASAAVDPANAASDAIADLAVTVTGVLATDYVQALPSATIEAGVQVSAVTPTADTVTLRLHNATAGAVNGASKTWEFLVQRF